MKQVIIIHGGHSYSSYDGYIKSLREQPVKYERLKLQKSWKPWIAEQMPESDVLLPSFPNGDNAVYDEWAIYFEKLITFFGDDVRLVGHSLGAMFLSKYLHTNKLPKKVSQLILIAGQYGEKPDDDVGSFVVTSAKGLEDSADEIHLFYSKDDPVITYDSLAAYEEDMPHAISHVYENRGHFNDETFPELLEVLNKNNLE